MLEKQRFKGRGPGRPFEKGKSGNPKGRPRNASSLTVLLREKLAEVCEYDKQQRTWQDMIVLATLKLAMEGNSSALREVWGRIDGKVTELISEQEPSYPTKIKVEFVESPYKNPAALCPDVSTFAGHHRTQNMKNSATRRLAGNRTEAENPTPTP